MNTSKLSKPGFKVGDIKSASLKQLQHLFMDDYRWPLQAPAVDTQKHVGGSKSDTLVAIYKGVTNSKAFQQCCSLSDDIVVITGL